MLILSRARKLCDQKHFFSTIGKHRTTPSTPYLLFSTAQLSTPPHAEDPTPSTPKSAIRGAAKDQAGTWSKALLFLPGAIAFGLGTWQVFRRQEKIEMLDHRRGRLEMEPILLNKAPLLGGDLGSLEFRKVAAMGSFDDSKSIFVGPRSRSISGVTENGYLLITPLILTTEAASDLDIVQKTILVNRGWIPRDWRNKPLEDSIDAQKGGLEIKTVDSPKEGIPWWKFWSRKSTDSEEPESTTSSARVIIGVVRGSEKPSIFVPPNDPSSGQWFYVDVPMIARACGLPEDTMYIEDIDVNINPSHPYPLPKDVKTLVHYSVMPQDHLNYMITWYTLSAAITFMAAKRIRQANLRMP